MNMEIYDHRAKIKRNAHIVKLHLNGMSYRKIARLIHAIYGDDLSEQYVGEICRRYNNKSYYASEEKYNKMKENYEEIMSEIIT